MSESQKKKQPKKIKLPPLVDRSQWHDTMSWVDNSSVDINKPSNEDNSENNSQGLSKLESE